jgi:hypothetical protein
MNIFEKPQSNEKEAEEPQEETELVSTSKSNKLFAFRKRMQTLALNTKQQIIKSIQTKLLQIIIKIKFTPVNMHLMNHKIFDGDGTYSVLYIYVI